MTSASLLWFCEKHFHGIINNIDTKAKCCHPKKFSCKRTLQPAGVCLSEAPSATMATNSPHPLYTLCVYACTVCSAQMVRIFFINARPAWCETEKDGEGERDTDRTVKGVPPCAHSLRQPVVPAHQTGGRRCRGEPPPLPQPYPFGPIWGCSGGSPG